MRRLLVLPWSEMLELLLALPFVFALVLLLARGASRTVSSWLAGAAPFAALVDRDVVADLFGTNEIGNGA